MNAIIGLLEPFEQHLLFSLGACIRLAQKQHSGETRRQRRSTSRQPMLERAGKLLTQERDCRIKRRLRALQQNILPARDDKLPIRWIEVSQCGARETLVSRLAPPAQLETGCPRLATAFPLPRKFAGVRNREVTRDADFSQVETVPCSSLDTETVQIV